MIFYQSGLEAVIWNPEKDCALAIFEKPHFTFKTDDPVVIEKLRAHGYQELPDTADDGKGDGPQVNRLRS